MKARIERFARAVRRLKGISEVPLEQFLADEDKIDASERNLQVAIEALTDIGEALISMMNWEAPKSYREVATLLSGHGVITPEQGRRLESWRINNNDEFFVSLYAGARDGPLRKITLWFCG